MIRKSIGACCALMVLACAGVTEDAGPPPCTDEAFTAAVEGKAPFEIDGFAHRACDDEHALVAVTYKCEECEPMEQYFLGANAGKWEILESGTGMDPGGCEAQKDEIDLDACQALWKAFLKQENGGEKKKKKKRKK